MGTNYYLHKKPCSSCGYEGGVQHIGKNSGAWAFTFQSGTNEPWEAWQEYLSKQIDRGNVIKDEYGDTITLDDFVALVDDSKGGMLYAPSETDGVYNFIPFDFI